MHSCPFCGQACYCNGDIDDIECDDTAADRCHHCDGDDSYDGEDDEPGCCMPDNCVVPDPYHHAWECMSADEAQMMMEAEELFQQEQREHHQRMEWRGLWCSLNERCKKDDNYALTRLERWGYVLKLLICYVLQLHPRDCHGSYPDAVQTALIHAAKTYGGWEADWMEVGEGWDRNWFYQLKHDSEWQL